jgi:4-carboxymuconolactone decarboxylase
VTRSGEPRVAPLPRAEWDETAARSALEAGFGPKVAEQFLATGPGAPAVPNVVGTLLHHPALAGPWLAFNRVLLFEPSLTARQRELMVLRVAWRTRSTYEWLQHVRMAARAEITPDEVDAIARGDVTTTFSALETDLLAATDQLLDDYRIDDDTWARLAAQLDVRQLMEVVFAVGAYTCLAMAFKSLSLQLDPELEALAVPRPE